MVPLDEHFVVNVYLAFVDSDFRKSFLKKKIQMNPYFLLLCVSLADNHKFFSGNATITMEMKHFKLIICTC